MKQFVIDQMKDYQHKKKIVKAIKYQEGMEDGWLAQYTTYIVDNPDTVLNTVNKIFYSKEEVNKYISSPTDETIRNDFCEYLEPLPVLLFEISGEDYDYTPAIAQNGQYFGYEDLNECTWIILDDKGNIRTEYDFEESYELIKNLDENLYNKPVAKIGYDEDLHEFFVKFNERKISIDEKNGIETVEKILDGLQIPFTERIGTYFAD